MPGVSGEALAKRMLKLAWDASSVRGMGVLQDRGPALSEDDIWSRKSDNGFGCKEGTINADYVFGRMMKLRLGYDATSVTIDDEYWSPDYQSFCRRFNNAEHLFDAAVASF